MRYPLNNSRLSIRQRLRDRDALVHIHGYFLLGRPAVAMLQYLKRRLGVAFFRRLVERFGRFKLRVGAPFNSAISAIGSIWHSRRYSLGNIPAANANESPFSPNAAAS